MPSQIICDPETVIKYIGRYLGRPVIATSRIDNYDGSILSLFITIAMKMINIYRKQSLLLDFIKASDPAYP